MKKCGRCAKPAVLHITELAQGKVKGLLHFCESCAKEYFSQGDSQDEEAAPVGDEGEDLQESLEHLICGSCGISFKEFRAQGRLGCPHDYIAFQEELLPLLENIHGETQHVGKVPKRAPHAGQRQVRLIRLRNRLKLAVEDENYEEAAALRDEIQTVERELSQQPPEAETP